MCAGTCADLTGQIISSLLDEWVHHTVDTHEVMSADDTGYTRYQGTSGLVIDDR